MREFERVREREKKEASEWASFLLLRANLHADDSPSQCFTSSDLATAHLWSIDNPPPLVPLYDDVSLLLRAVPTIFTPSHSLSADSSLCAGVLMCVFLVCACSHVRITALRWALARTRTSAVEVAVVRVESQAQRAITATEGKPVAETRDTNTLGLVTNECALVTNTLGLVTNTLGLVTNTLGLVTNTLGLVTNEIGLVMNTLALVTNEIGLVTNECALVTTVEASEFAIVSGSPAATTTEGIGPLAVIETVVGTGGRIVAGRSESMTASARGTVSHSMMCEIATAGVRVGLRCGRLVRHRWM
jgi:hypothetical protein